MKVCDFCKYSADFPYLCMRKRHATAPPSGRQNPVKQGLRRKKGNKMDRKTALLGMTPDELGSVARELGMPAFAGGQMAKWIYRHRQKKRNLIRQLEAVVYDY